MRYLILILLFSLSLWAFSQCGACEYSVQLINNGNFSFGNTGFNTELNLGTGFFCPLCSEGTYAIGTNAFFYHTDFAGTDHTNPGSGQYFIANGTGAAGINVWCQTVDVEPNTDYTFSFWARDVNPNPNVHPLAELVVTFNGEVSSDTLFAQGGWSNLTFTWNSGLLETVEVCIQNEQDQTGGNDFGIDDISMTACYSYVLSQQANAGVDQTTCSTVPIALGVPGSTGYNYYWQPNAGLSSLTSAQPTFQWTNTGTEPITEVLYLTVDSANVGCISYDTVYVTVMPVPPLDLGSDLVICPGESASLNAGTGWDAVLWSNGASTDLIIVDEPNVYSVDATFGACVVSDEIAVVQVILPSIDLGEDIQACDGDVLSISSGGSMGTWNTGQNAASILVTESGDYSFTYSDQGCSVSDEVNVTFYTYPTVDVTGPSILCENTTITLTADTEGLWSTGDVGNSITVIEEGYYYLSIYNGPCLGLDGIEVEYVELPIAPQFDNVTLCEGESVEWDGTSEFVTDYLWSTGETTPIIEADSAGFYTLQVSNVCGSDVSEVALSKEVCGWGLFIPNSFTPNGDLLNDAWIIQGYNVSNLEIFVYNRLGDLIFYTDDPSVGWEPGDLIGRDVYNYRVEAINYFGEAIEQEGFVVLTR